MADEHVNYVMSNRFYVEIEQNLAASFTECSGLGMTVKKETHQEGGVNDQQRVIIGPTEFSDVTLKRGLTNDLTFYDWIAALLKTRKANTAVSQLRRNVNILTFNQAGETMQCWTLIGAVPVGWSAPSLTADSSGVAIEELTLAYEGLTVVKDSGGGGAEVLNAQRPSSGYFST
ncbi:phage tail protein [Synechococcus sp. PCC 7336]|uniref:phage tail protein n=1 Tax=Synechococcus sp. PCC 7336 TaxID=195250 RepID=UPI00034B956D|nr:phage tail protein [Synechococcus sp. PCC 7336]